MAGSQPQHKHKPERICVVCRSKAEKRSLTRLVRTDAGLQVDASGKMRGRGAYLCDTQKCWERAVKTNVLSQALRMTLTEDDRQRLQQAMPSNHG